MRIFDKIIRTAITTAVLASSGMTAPVYAAGNTTTNTFGVSANVNNACSVSGTNLAFGTYDPLSTTALDASSTISVLCTLGDAYNIRLDKGLHGSSVTTRQMSDGAAHSLNYALFRDSARTLNWGESDGTDTQDSTGTGVSQGFPVYGRVAALQNVPQGSYNDTITITVNF